MKPTSALRLFVLLALCCLLAAACNEREAGSSRAVPEPTRIEQGTWSGFPAGLPDAFVRGVTAANWFTHRSDARLIPGWPDASDFGRMRKLGLRHVRVLLDPDWLQMNAAHPRYVDAGLRQALDAGLMVVLSMQPSSEHKQRMAREEAAVEALAAQWTLIASVFASIPVDRLVFEVLNEPETEDVARAMRIQQRLIDVVRAVTPGRVVVVGGAHFSDIADLVALQPLPLPGVVYSFHFYEPHNFTHQGATWGWPMWMLLRDMPYPSSPEALAPVLPKLAEVAREHAAWYGQQSWNKARLAEFIDQAANWSQKHRVPVWCSEFGVLREAVPPDSRRAWLGDARSLFESRDIAWTYFDWWGHFGLVTGTPGARAVDPDVAVGLGLNAE
ncbi:MAG: glycoside hydrolase family 5 protein [Panacagrimonas sp.]